ncbi:MAG: hypothetical protein K6E86_09005 [Bacteroidales bacterium]|nr:hypothetical protein [Bacteroidales bacterium]
MARGHHYHIDHIDCLSQINPYDGDLTLKCADCDKTNENIPFCHADIFGLADSYRTEGYWCKSELIHTDTMPTCVTGYGTYELTVNYHGTRSSETYQHFIPANGYLHHYDDDGVCREQHYVMKYMGASDRISKDKDGFIQYQMDSDEEPIVDNTVYSTNGYTVTPYKQQFLTTGLVSMPIYDPEDGSAMTYTEYDVQQYDSRSSLESALSGMTYPHYIGIVGNFSIGGSPIFTDPNSLGVIQHGPGVYCTIRDAKVYSATSDFRLASLSYYRSFANTLWQPLYVPFSIPVEDMEAKGLQVARLNDTHMYDIDFDGDIDSVTVEFIRLTSGTLLPNRPYLIRSTTESNNYTANWFYTDIYKAVENSIECSTVDQTISIVGTYSGLAEGVMYNNNYYALNAQGGLSRAASTAATLKPQRWYMKVENKDGSPIATNDYFAASIRVMGEWGDEEVTGIEELPTETEAEGERQVYSLDGMRVIDGKQLQRGVYVDNGRRIVVH